MEYSPASGILESMNYKWYLLISLFALLAGGLLTLYLQQSIIIYWPTTKQPTLLVEKKVSSLNKIQLFFWQQNQWKSEEVELLQNQDYATNLHYLISRWLTFMEEEGMNRKKVALQSVALEGPGQIAYLSFDRNPFDKESSCFDKWIWIEGLLRTIQETGINLSGIQFLVHHQPLYDYHLDFSYPWPPSGFLEK